MRDEDPQFDVALSFVGEDREYIEKVAACLKEMAIHVFYDKYETETLLGQDLYNYLREIFQKRAKNIVIFISRNYANKLWTNHERTSAQARAFSEYRNYILLAKFDDTEIPGILPITDYVDLKNISPQEFAEIIKQHIGRIERFEFYPKNIDKLIEYLEIHDENQIEEVNYLADSFFEALKLIKPHERYVLATAVGFSCPVELPNNVHINIEYLGQLLSISREEIISLFARLDCPDLKYRIYESKHEEDEDLETNTKEIIEIQFKPLLRDYEGNANYIMIGIFKCIFDNLCQHCSKAAIKRLDFSILSTSTGYPDPMN